LNTRATALVADSRSNCSHRREFRLRRWFTGACSSSLYISSLLRKRDAYFAECVEVVEAARAAPGCLDFSVTADSADPARVRIYERWESEPEFLAFRGSGPSARQPWLDSEPHGVRSFAAADIERASRRLVGDLGGEG